MISALAELANPVNKRKLTLVALNLKVNCLVPVITAKTLPQPLQATEIITDGDIDPGLNYSP